MKTKKAQNNLRIAFVVPHIFIHRDILPGVIFSPGKLAIDLCEELTQQGSGVTLFAPGPVDTKVPVVTADLGYFEQELAGRGYGYLELLKKHPFTFISLARQVQSELIAKAFAAANNDEFDIVHIYTNEEDIALPFAQLCSKPVVFTHHDPFNFLIKYKNTFPKYKHLNWISMSNAQRAGMPEGTNWVGNVYHGLDAAQWKPNYSPTGEYVAYLGRIVEPKGVHHAIAAVKEYNKTAATPLKLKIAGKHYTGHGKDAYWQNTIEPELGGDIEYVGHISDLAAKQEFLGNARALIVPSLFDEPFGMVTIEALACGTPVLGSPSGATPELIRDGVTGYIATPDTIPDALVRVDTIDRHVCRKEFEERFTLGRMAEEHLGIYRDLV